MPECLIVARCLILSAVEISEDESALIYPLYDDFQNAASFLSLPMERMAQFLRKIAVLKLGSWLCKSIDRRLVRFRHF